MTATGGTQEPEVRIDGPDGGVLTVRLNAPARLNAVDVPMLRSVVDAIKAAGGDPAVRAIVLTGTGRAFCAGADLSAGPERRGSTPSGMIDAVNETVRAITASRKPVVCIVNGIAAGIGVSFALASDIAIAPSSATFVMSFSAIGLIPDGGATALMAASIGRARTMRLAFTAERLSAENAAREGLIAYALPDEDFAAASSAIIQSFAAAATRALSEVKHIVNAATLPTLGTQLDAERASQLELKHSRDHREGIQAFSERRKPAFIGA